jgi:hypothetical protein
MGPDVSRLADGRLLDHSRVALIRGDAQQLGRAARPMIEAAARRRDRGKHAFFSREPAVVATTVPGRRVAAPGDSRFPVPYHKPSAFIPQRKPE